MRAPARHLVLAVLVAAAGCGRIGFDAVQDDPSCVGECGGSFVACGDGDTGVLGCPAGCACDHVCAESPCETRCDGADTTCGVTLDSQTALWAVCSRGASCSYDATGGAEAVYDCGQGATCDVTCGGTSDCTVACTGGAACVLSCDGSSDCSFALCDGAEMTCGDGSIVCNRACP
jgi:hypothetical protein